MKNITNLPKPTGQYLVGTVKYDLEDHHRKSLQFPKGRLIPIQLYFPMEIGSQTVHPKIKEERAALGSFESLQVDGYSQPTDLSRLQEGKHSLIIINHASYVAMTDYAFLAEDLSSHGYIVVSIQHELKSDGDEPLFWEGSSCSKNAKIIDNMLFVFEWLQDNQKTLFENKCNLNCVGLIGHSLGANSLALWLSRTHNDFQKDTRKTLFRRVDQQDVKECIILMESTRFSYPFNMQFPTFFLLAEGREKYHKETGCFDQKVLNQKVKYYKGSTHISFMDHGYANNQPEYFIGTQQERKAFFETVRQDIRDFLKECGV